MTEDQLYNDISELNNQLTNLTRELNKSNITLKSEINKRKEAEENIKTLLNSTEDEIVLLDENGKIVYINEISKKSLNIEEDSEGEPYNQFIPELYRKIWIEYFNKAVINNSFIQFEQEIAGKTYQIAFFPAEKKTDAAGSIACYKRDVTDQKKIYENLMITERFNDARRFSSNMAHEINNNMAGLYGQLMILEHKLSADQSLNKYIKASRIAGDKILKLTDQLLYYTQGNFIDYKNSDIGDILERFQKAYIDIIPDTINLITSYNHKEMNIKADPELIVQMLIQVLTNSIEAIGKDEGEIVIKTSIEDEQLIISIADNGVGIPDDIIERVTEPFFSTKFLGRGLGLSSASGIASSHGGSIEIKSKAGIETRVQIFLPVQDHSD